MQGSSCQLAELKEFTLSADSSGEGGNELPVCIVQAAGWLCLTATCCLQIDLVKGMMDCLYAECKPCITDCVIAELEKLGQRYRVALKVAKVQLLLLLCCATLESTYTSLCRYLHVNGAPKALKTCALDEDAGKCLCFAQQYFV